MVSSIKAGVPFIGPAVDKKEETNIPVTYKDRAITYGVMGGQRLYFISQDSNGPKGRIDLAQTLYGIPQDNFIGAERSISNLTYPTVRGDELMSLLQKIVSFIAGHVHPVSTMPPVPVASGNGQTLGEIQSILADSENTILNQNIRINWYL